MSDITRSFDDVTRFSLIYKMDQDQYMEPCPKWDFISVERLRILPFRASEYGTHIPPLTWLQRDPPENEWTEPGDPGVNARHSSSDD
jgi:hypothetical protein